MHINDFDYELPQELIAQTPAEKRDFSRLMVVDRATGSVEHKHFYDIIDYLQPTDCLVLNNSKVLPARLYGTKEGTGAKVEFLLIKRIEGDIWETMVRPGKRLKPGDAVSFSDDRLFRAVGTARAQILRRHGGNGRAHGDGGQNGEAVELADRADGGGRVHAEGVDERRDEQER